MASKIRQFVEYARTLANNVASSNQINADLLDGQDGSYYAPIASPTFTGTVSGITKSMVGLGNVDNTADSAKSVNYASSAGTASSANAVNTGNNYQMNSLGIGTGASGTAGEIRATNNITAYYSDERLKTKLGNIEDALSKVCSISGFYYEANETAQALGYKVIKEVGVSAQEVQRVLPEVVVSAPIDDKYLTVRYERIVPLLIEAIKELKTEIEQLKKA